MGLGAREVRARPLVQEGLEGLAGRQQREVGRQFAAELEAAARRCETRGPAKQVGWSQVAKSRLVAGQ